MISIFECITFVKDKLHLNIIFKQAIQQSSTDYSHKLTRIIERRHEYNRNSPSGESKKNLRKLNYLNKLRNDVGIGVANSMRSPVTGCVKQSM